MAIINDFLSKTPEVAFSDLDRKTLNKHKLDAKYYKVREQFIYAGMRYALARARTWAYRNNLPYDDLESVAFEGLIRGVDVLHNTDKPVMYIIREYVDHACVRYIEKYKYSFKHEFDSIEEPVKFGSLDALDDYGNPIYSTIASDQPEDTEYSNAIIHRFISSLDTTDSTIISQYYGIGTFPRGSEQVAAELGVSGQTVRRKVQSILQRLRSVDISDL